MAFYGIDCVNTDVFRYLIFFFLVRFVFGHEFVTMFSYLTSFFMTFSAATR